MIQTSVHPWYDEDNDQQRHNDWDEIVLPNALSEGLGEEKTAAFISS